MNQALLFNDDLEFDQQQDAWRFTALLSGQRITIYFHSMQLKQLGEIDSCTKFDLEEIVELWLEKNEPEEEVIHINMR
jgi:hypothetical protein